MAICESKGLRSEMQTLWQNRSKNKHNNKLKFSLNAHKEIQSNTADRQRGQIRSDWHQTGNQGCNITTPRTTKQRGWWDRDTQVLTGEHIAPMGPTQVCTLKKDLRLLRKCQCWPWTFSGSNATTLCETAGNVELESQYSASKNDFLPYRGWGAGRQQSCLWWTCSHLSWSHFNIFVMYSSPVIQTCRCPLASPANMFRLVWSVSSR